MFLLASFKGADVRGADVTAMPLSPPVSKLLVSHNTQPPLPQTGCKAQSITPTCNHPSPSASLFSGGPNPPQPFPLRAHTSLPHLYSPCPHTCSVSPNYPGLFLFHLSSLHVPASVAHRSYPVAASGLTPCYISAAHQLC